MGNIIDSKILIILLYLAYSFGTVYSGLTADVYDVDILIAGGSLSALAAAITVGNLTKYNSKPLKIVWLEPTDWPGGQLTASSVPPDFGDQNQAAVNLPQSFVQLLQAMVGSNWNNNPGKCWVSSKCFESQVAVNYINKLLGNYPNIKLFRNTIVKSSKRSSEPSSKGRNLIEVIGIQRVPTNSSTGYESAYSEDVYDWYSTEDSTKFTKKVLRFVEPKVVIEASEYGDILMTSGMIGVVQGVEYPEETSDKTDSTCGQATVYPFHMNYNPYDEGETDVPAGSDGGYQYSSVGLTWQQIWTYRRVKGNGDYVHVYPKEISNQNLNNDYLSGYMFVPFEDALAEVQSKEGWRGGLNLTSLNGAEQRSYGWYHYLVNISSATEDVNANFLSINTSQVGTQHMLTKMPYLRDTRRVQYGIDDFRLTYSDLNYSNPEDNGATAMHFDDTIGIGVYHYADIHGLNSGVCANPYPSYITCCSHPLKPYYIPFRSITSKEVDNILVSGKLIAQSFLANAGTRLHPIEWATGTAAGAAAFLMITEGWNSTVQVYNNVKYLQSMLESDIIKSPLVWTFD